MDCRRRLAGKQGFFPWLQQVKLSRLVIIIFVVFICIFLIVHYFLSDLSPVGESPAGHRSRLKLDHYGEDERLFTAPNLSDEIMKLSKIKASVNNELREMESKRQTLQTQISRYQMELEHLHNVKDTLEREIKLTKLNLDQLKIQKEELDEKYVPILRAPQKILLGQESGVDVSPPNTSSNCRMFSCFDYSRCSLLSGFPVYVYDLKQLRTLSSVEDFINSSVSLAFKKSPYLTSDPSKACIFIVVIGQFQEMQVVSTKDMESFLHSLPYWHGDGRNHILINMMRNYKSTDIFANVKTDRAIVVQSTFLDTIFRPKFDIVIPPALGNADGDVWQDLPLVSPIRRKYFLSFLGQYKGIIAQNSAKIEGVEKVSQDLSENNMLSSIESAIVSSLKDIKIADSNEILTQFSCDSVAPGAINGEWSMCSTEMQRKETLTQSTFSLIIAPSNISYVSSTIFQLRLYESLKYGAIPVILGEHVQLPYSEVLEWKEAVIILPKARSAEFYFLLRTYTDNNIAAMRLKGRFLFENYFSSTLKIVNSLLAILRTRLSIPAAPIHDVPSVSVFNDSFVPLALEGFEVNPETDETLGPVESPFPSMIFKENFTQFLSYQSWNKMGQVFNMFPYDAEEKILPSEAKFFGSGFGFRPIGKGWGGAGKEFSEALGGNLVREQFTIVMLTYKREQVLINALQRLKGLPFLNRVIVVWNNPTPPSALIRWPEIGVPVKVLKMEKNSLNNRFLPFSSIETEAILSIDDDAHLRHDEIVFAFRVWREERDRIVGFPGRYHAWDAQSKAWYYNANYSCELSMVLTGAAFFHKNYAYLYTHIMPQAIRDKVDEYINCEDIAMNFLVSHITRKPPMKVTSRWTFRCPGCPETLSSDIEHFNERHKCINFFVQVYGYMPLLYTQYRVDSVLFKTRLPVEKQKCFKFI